MIPDAPFLMIKDLVLDLIKNPRLVYDSFARYQNDRSCSYPPGKVPLSDIFYFVPDAMEQTVQLQGIFELPRFPRHFPGEAERYTASTGLADTYALSLMAKRFAKKSIIEVGTSFGQSALAFALNTPSSVQVTTLDIQRVEDNPTLGSAFRGRPIADRIQMVTSTLEQLAPKLEPNSVDLIFIDGDHSYNGCKSDTLAALKLIRPGGLICWHDYIFRFRHGVVRALDEVRSETGLDIRHLAHTDVSAAVAPG
jgi:predicted O-methyltransferase YrrM